MAASAVLHAALYNARRRHRAFAARRAFDALEASPHDFGNIAADATSSNALEIPAGCRLAIALDDAIAAGDVTIETADGRSIAAPAAVADQVVVVSGWFRRSLDIEIGRAAGAPAGDLSVYFCDQDRRILIASATFTA